MKGSHYFRTSSLYFHTIGAEISKNDAQNHSVFYISTPNSVEISKSGAKISKSGMEISFA
jgi:hypothetical protein